MKRFIYLNIALVLLTLGACKKSELQSFSANAAVNFINTTSTYTFLGNATGEHIHEIPVRIIGNAADKDRSFSVEVIADSTTTATADLYEVLGGEVKAGEFEGVARVKVKNAPALASSQVKLAIKIVSGSDFKQGNVESINHTLTWTDQAVIPSWTYFGIFFCQRSSQRVYKLIVETTGLTLLNASIYGQLQEHGAQALGVKFGNYVKQWNKDHPNDKLIHDTGVAAGQEIVPRFWDKTLYP